MAEIYKGVIQDVISQVKEAFLDENVDIDVLTQLKKEWEDKVIASGCVDMEPRHTHAPHAPHQVAPPPMRGHVMQPRMDGVSIAFWHDEPYRTRKTNANAIRSAAGHAANPSPGQQIPVTVGPNGVLQHRLQQAHGGHQLHQLDGNGCFVEDSNEMSSSDAPCSSKTFAPKSHKRVSKKKDGITDREALRIAKDLLTALQLDGGGGGGMSDSSSEEEEVDDDDDPIRRIADRIGDGQIEDGEQAVRENPVFSLVEN
ncbi:hypothetical protein TELCIR_09224 [Teladorsagia circumcincta]|uniref:Uncharacterized protein n=1 Tax=Teladorsagia circumcincta TaxID=45464 RepID=A0A2G9UFE5_TELCI|nr:hypothetical protein TELCIR_09224 [Teladorsagia circumcincta]